MERLRRLAVLALVLALTGSASVDAGADDTSFTVIVHPDNPISTIDRAFLRAAFLKKKKEWSDGTTIRTVDLRKTLPVRERFAREVLKKTLPQLKNYWNQQVFSGKGVPPPEVESVPAMINYVRTHRGAVGYLPAGVDPGGAKVVELR
jgi:hypothetical protein